ncbi:MAG: hypothetical protein DRJ42_05320 [Deltaproteobacteria bacterium]|nr:MAG: hypothetical protein DRJ42_05320 [Deltaproteobacteria bacterium]
MRRQFQTAILVSGILWLAACAATSDGGGTDKGATSDVRGDAEVEALLTALDWYAETGARRSDDARFEPVQEIAIALMDRAAIGELSPSATTRLREVVIPMLSEVVRGRAIAAEALVLCGDLPTDRPLTPPILQGAVSRGPITYWEGDTDTGIRELLEVPVEDVWDQIDRGGDTRDLVDALAIERTTQALTSLLRLRALLVPGAAASLRADPALEIYAVLALLPAGLHSHRDALEARLRERVEPVAQSIDEATITQLRHETVEGMVRVLDAIREVTGPIDADVTPRTVESVHIDTVEAACRTELQKWGQMNVLLLTPTAERRFCTYGTHFSYAPSDSDLDAYEADLVAAALAYLDQLQTALDESDPREAAKRLLVGDTAALGAVLADEPRHMFEACSLAEEALADAESARFWDSVVLWTTVGVGVIALATGVGALVLGGSTTVLGTTLGAVAATTGFAAAIVSTGGSAYLGYRGATVLRQANHNLEALLVSDGDPASIAADREYAHGLILDALVGGTLSAGELVSGVRFAMNAVRLRGLSATERVRDLVENSARARGQWRDFQRDMVDGGQIRRATDGGETLFASRVLRSPNPKSADEVRQIVRDAMDDQSDLFAEVERYLGTSGGVADDTLWDAYFRSYDNMLLWAEEYQALVSHANRVLPRGGVIVDAGAGTGNFSAFMARNAPDRDVISFEYSAFQRTRIEGKMSVVGGPGASPRVITGSLTEVDSIAGGADGYVLNNVLYALGDEGEGALRMIVDDLNPGGVFYLNDPLRGLGTDGARLSALIEELAVSAWRNGAPLTAHDIAVIAAVNSGRLVRSAGGSAPAFRSVDELHDLAGRLGLEVVEEGPSYFGTSYTMVLRKPG